MEPIIQMQGITKVFPGTVANDHVDLEIQKGEIHALLGENGAGKSTLMNILAGLYRPDSGAMRIAGEEVHFSSPKDALSRGIGMIHQHFKLVDAFTVTENILLGDAKASAFLRRSKMEAQIRALGEQYGMQVDPSAYIWQLSVGEQQRVEILKALYRKANILVLDEPTAVLTPQETDRLFDTLREMARQGCTIIIITHKLTEVVEIAHRVTVMRRGQVTGGAEGDDVNYASLSRMMMGSEVKQEQSTRQYLMGAEELQVSHLSALGEKSVKALDDLSFALRQGEILGVAGVAGNGQRELGETLAGLRSATDGRILLSGEDIMGKSPRQILQKGLAFVPEDRLGTGLVGNMNSYDNFVLRDYFTQKGVFLNYKEAKARTEEAIQTYDIAMASPTAPVRLMSGGNLQKLLLAREIALQPKVLILSYPVRGLDLGATERIYELMLQQRDQGCAVLFISEDLEALLRFSDRIMVLYRGRMTGMVDRERASVTDIGMMMMGTSKQEEARHEVYSHF